MLENPTAFILPTSKDPIGDAIRSNPDWSSFQCAPGDLPRARGPWGGKNGIHIVGWDRTRGITTIKRDDLVGSTDSFILGEGDSNFVLEDLNIEVDDRAGVKTNPGVGPKHALIGCNIFGKGSPIDPNWTDTGKWGVHAYDTAGWNEVRVAKWSVFQEHGNYFHNVKGVHNFAQGTWAWMGGCAVLVVNRQNEGSAGVGDFNFRDCYIEDVCIGQGGSALTFRGGMPTSIVTMERVTARLGCHRRLAMPWADNICGVVSVDEADETRPGAGDAAWPGGTGQLILHDCDFEVGTVYHGRTGQIRPVVQVSALGSLVISNTRIAVTRASGAYPIALAIGPGVTSIKFLGSNQIDGWIDYQGTRFTSLALFKNAYSEFFP